MIIVEDTDKDMCLLYFPSRTQRWQLLC